MNNPNFFNLKEVGRFMGRLECGGCVKNSYQIFLEGLFSMRENWFECALISLSSPSASLNKKKRQSTDIQIFICSDRQTDKQKNSWLDKQNEQFFTI